MGAFIDLTGQKFNKLKVIKKSKNRSFNSIVWECECECGNLRDARSADLRKNKVTSCGDLNCRSNFVDLTGKKIGKLTVIRQLDKKYSNGDTAWLCKCECCTEKVLRSQTLRSESVKSCGAYKCQSCFMDLTGQRFGKLIVVKFSRFVGKQNISMWMCDCDCGGTVEVRAATLKIGHTKSCGCLRLDGQYETIKTTVYRHHVVKAAQRNIVTHLSIDEYLSIASQACHYCGQIGTRKNNFTKATIPLNGIDRKNNELYYKNENSLACCKECNWMKGKMSYVEFISVIRKLFEFTKNIKIGQEASKESGR